MSHFETLKNLVLDLKASEALIYASKNLKSENKTSAIGMVFYVDEEEQLLYKFSNSNYGVTALSIEAKTKPNQYALPIVFKNSLMQVYKLPSLMFSNMEEVDSFFSSNSNYTSIYDYLRYNSGMLSFIEENKLDLQLQTEYENLAVYENKITFINYGCSSSLENEITQEFFGKATVSTEEVESSLELYED